MEDTGRIQKSLLQEAFAAAMGPQLNSGVLEELALISEVDKAHLVMLVEQGIIQSVDAAAVIGAIQHLENNQYSPIRASEAKRGVFLAYEDYLIQELGSSGGILQTCRSRNDLNATLIRLRLRHGWSTTLRHSLGLLAALTRRSSKWAEVAMPIYTHRQPGMPGTFGFYLAAVASSLLRDIEALWSVVSDLQRSPLGAGAGGGCELNINPVRTASLLGFETVFRNSLDAVASRDIVLRFLAALTVMNTTLSRLAADWLMWTTEEFNFLHLPDELVGSSSAMPQKRNPFLLEHIAGRTALSLGSLVSAVSAMRSEPFTNSIATGTEGTRPVWGAIDATNEVLCLTRLLVVHANPNPPAMHKRAVEGYTVTTALAHRLMQTEKIDFRSAHHHMGSMIRSEIEQSLSPASGLRSSYDPADAALAAEYGGGPGRVSQRLALSDLKRQQIRIHHNYRSLLQHWQQARLALRAACASPTNPGPDTEIA